MNDQRSPVTVLNEAECWERLATQRIGRIVTRVRDIVDIVPINFVVDEGTLVFRTAPGSKLAELAISPSVLFEVDSFSEDRGWSVVVRGEAAIISGEADQLAAEALPLRTNVATVKPVFVRITPTSLGGRAFVFRGEGDSEGGEE